MSSEETLTPLEKLMTTQYCASCGKDDEDADDEGKMRRCSKCRNAWYCNATCQRANWKFHQVLCKQQQKNRKELGGEGRRLQRLLLTWRDKMKRTLFPFFLLSKFSEDEFHMQPPSQALELRTTFDCNLQTFVLERPPTTFPFSLSESMSVEYLAEVQERISRDPNLRVHYIVIWCSELPGATFTVPCGFQPEVYQDHYSSTGLSPPLPPMDTLMDKTLRPEYILKSSLFEDWQQRRFDNIARGVNALKMQRPNEWMEFLLNELHINTDHPKCRTHVVGVVVELGRGLGEIKEIVDCGRMAVADAKTMCESVFGNVDHLFDLENSPMARPGGQQFVTVFLQRKRSRPLFAFSDSCIVPTPTETFTAEECDEKADGIVNELNQVTFPVFDYPSLD